jgi:hypothetical protein
MSTLGQKQTSTHVCVMLVLAPKADIDRLPRNVSFVSEADVAGAEFSAHQKRNLRAWGRWLMPGAPLVTISS